MVTPEIGYISVNKFGANTYKEFLTAIAKLQKANAKKLISIYVVMLVGIWMLL